jgi:SAM-dependent methyltransferase
MSDDEARRFTAEHAHYTEDVPFWRDAAERLGSPVLDLGAAAGRVAIPLARDGHEVWAVDRSPEMLAQIRRLLAGEAPEVAARLRTVEGELQSFGLDRTFRLIIVAMNTLQVLTEPEHRAACMRRVRAHLAEDGEFIFDVALPDVEEIRDTMGVERPSGRHAEPDGSVLSHSAWYESWDEATHTLEFTIRIVERRDGMETGEALRHHRVHLFTPAELSGLLTDAGLAQISVSGDFAGSPLDRDAERQIHRCRVAA